MRLKTSDFKSAEKGAEVQYLIAMAEKIEAVEKFFAHQSLILYRDKHCNSNFLILGDFQPSQGIEFTHYIDRATSQ